MNLRDNVDRRRTETNDWVQGKGAIGLFLFVVAITVPLIVVIAIGIFGAIADLFT